jgi:hypothetical protein
MQCCYTKGYRFGQAVSYQEQQSIAFQSLVELATVWLLESSYEYLLVQADGRELELTFGNPIAGDLLART